MDNLVFLKLGGSLITDKTQPYTARHEKLDLIAAEIKSALKRAPGLKLILGHGSGSFGHFAVQEQSAMLHLPPFSLKGKENQDNGYWKGFSEVWFRASQLNRIVMEALKNASIQAISIPPSATVSARDGIIQEWDQSSLHSALKADLVPVIYGDIVFDGARGGVVLSTEDLLFYMAHQIQIKCVLLAGLEEAVWADFPTRKRAVEKITPSTFNSVSSKIGASHGVDVTGGMRSKVEEMLQLVQQIPDLSVHIFSGEKTGNIEKALAGERLGTLIEGDKV